MNATNLLERPWAKNALFIALAITGLAALTGTILVGDPRPKAGAYRPVREEDDEFRKVVAEVNAEFRDDWAHLRALNIEVFGVNPRGGASHSRFRQKFGFPFPLLVDRGQRVAALYQADAGILVKRTVYLIDPDGAIRYSKRGKPSPEEVMAAAR